MQRNESVAFVNANEQMIKMSVKSGLPVYMRAMAIVLLFAMFHYVAGYRLMYSLGILYAKEEAKECITEKNNNIKKFTLSTAEYNSLKWSDANKEFSLSNEMYDVVSIQKSGDKYSIIAYIDNDETEWLSAFHNFEKELFQPDHSANGTKSAEDVMSSFQKDCTPVSEFKIQLFAFTGILTHALAVQQRPLQVSGNIWHPPTIS
jgi:hypothetical protein